MTGSEPNSPLTNEYTERFEDTLEMIEDLNSMGVLPKKPSIRFPKIVVVGDESSGKSSLISNLIGLKLPSSVKTPFVVKFELHSSPSPDRKIFLRYEGDADMEISEDEIGSRFQKELETKTYMGFSVVIKQNHVSHLTIVDLPGIKEYVGNIEEQENEFERIKGYIMDYTSYEDCVFIDVISASNSTTRYLSTKLISDFDLSGKRTVSVVTKIDQILHEQNHNYFTKFTMNKITTPFGYTFVSNISMKMSKTTNESQLASIIRKKYFGFRVVAKNIVTAMLSILFKTSSFIVQQIDIDLQQCDKEMNQSNDDFKTVGEARPTMLMIATKSQYSLYRLVITKDYSQYQNDTQMHAYLRLNDILGVFQTKLANLKFSKNTPFLLDEIDMLRDLNSSLPWNMHSSFSFNSLFHKLLDYASTLVDSTVSNIFDYLNILVLKVVSDHAVDHKRLNSSLRKHVINMLANTRLGFQEKVAKVLDLEKYYSATLNPSFNSSCEKYKHVRLDVTDLQKNIVVIDGLGEVQVSHLKHYPETTWKKAFDMKMLICANWEPVSRRITHNITQMLMESLMGMVTGEMVTTVMEPFMKIGEEQKELSDEEPMLSVNRAILTNRSNYLKEAKEEIEKIQHDLKFLLL